MGLSSILSVIHTVIIDTMLNFNPATVSGNNGHWLKKRSLVTQSGTVEDSAESRTHDLSQISPVFYH